MVCQAENMPFFLEHPRNKSISVFQIMLCHGRGLDCKGTSNLYAFLQPFESNTIIITTRVGRAFGNSSIKLHRYNSIKKLQIKALKCSTVLWCITVQKSSGSDQKIRPMPTISYLNSKYYTCFLIKMDFFSSILWMCGITKPLFVLHIQHYCCHQSQHLNSLLLSSNVLIDCKLLSLTDNSLL